MTVLTFLTQQTIQMQIVWKYGKLRLKTQAYPSLRRQDLGNKHLTYPLKPLSNLRSS